MNFRKTCLLCAGLVTSLGMIWMVGVPLQAGHAGSATGVGSVFAAKAEQEPVTHRQPVSLRMLARVLHHCDENGKPIHAGFVRWASRAIPSGEGVDAFPHVSGDQLFGRDSFQSVSNKTR